MDVDERIEAALAAGECAGVGTLLAALVYALRAEGRSKQAIAVGFADKRRRLRSAGRERDAAAVADLLAVLTGRCPAAARLLPDEPDAELPEI